MKPYEVVATVREVYPNIKAARKRTAAVTHSVIRVVKAPAQVFGVVLAVTVFLGFFFGIHAYQVYVEHHPHSWFKAHPHADGEMPLIVGIIWSSVWGGLMLLVLGRGTWIWMSNAEHWPWENGHRPWQKQLPAPTPVKAVVPPWGSAEYVADVRSTREWAP